jgi:hypothetical protein
MERSEIEQALGRKMHEISIQQEIVQKENTKLKKLNDEANELDNKLKELDGK